MKQVYTFTPLLIASAAFSQDTRVLRNVEWKVIVTDSIKRVNYGYLAGMADSGIIMVKNSVMFGHSLVGTTANMIAYQNLSTIRIQGEAAWEEGSFLTG